jgi:hypothetical protein
MRRMNGTQSTSNRSSKHQSSSRDDLAWLFDGRPDARGAIQERLEQYPEYVVWLQGLSSGVLHAVQQEN